MEDNDILQSLSSQLTSIFLFLHGKRKEFEGKDYPQALTTVLNSAPDYQFTQETLRIIKTFDKTSKKDAKLIMKTVQNMIFELVNEDNCFMVFYNCFMNLYNGLEIICLLKDTPKQGPHERFQTELYIPSSFFKSLEKNLEFFYNMFCKFEKADKSKVNPDIVECLVNIITNIPTTTKPLKRYEGKILSILTENQEILEEFNKILDKMISPKMHKDEKYSLIQTFQLVKFIRYDFKHENQEKIISVFNERIKDALKQKSLSLQEEMVHFVARSMCYLRISKDFQYDKKFLDNLTKITNDMFKKLGGKNIKKQLMKAAIRIVSLFPEKQFKSYNVKLFSILAKCSQNQTPKDMIKYCMLIGKVFSKYISDEEFIRFSYETMFEKSKLPIVRPMYSSQISLMSSFFADLARQNFKYVLPILKNISTSIQQLKEYPDSLLFLFETVSKIRKFNEEISINLVPLLEPSLSSILSASSPTPVITGALPLIGTFWKLASRTHLTIPSIIQQLAGHREQEVVSCVCVSFVEMMKTIPPKEFPMNVTFSIPYNLMIGMHNKTPLPTMVRLSNMLGDFLEALLQMMSQCEQASYIEDWKGLIQTLDSTIFPFLFNSNNALKIALKRIMSIVTPALTFPSLCKCFEEYSGTIYQKLLKGIVEYPSAFIDIFIQASEFWMKMDLTNDPEYSSSLLQGLCCIARTTRGKLNVTCTPVFCRSMIEYLLRCPQKVIQNILYNLHPSVWPVFFNEFETVYNKANGEPALSFQYIAYAFVTNSKLTQVKEGLNFFFDFNYKFYNSKRCRFERDYPMEILSLNICSSFLRAFPERVIEFSNQVSSSTQMMERIMSRVNPKEIFVINPNYMFAFIDYISAIVSSIKLEPIMIEKLIDYLLKIAFKSFDQPIIQYIITDTISNLYTKNSEYRSNIIKTALLSPSLQLNEISRAILSTFNSDAPKERRELLSILVLADALLSLPNSISHDLGFKLTNNAIYLLSNKKFILTNPLAKYSPESEDKMSQIINEFLNDDEIIEFAQILSSVIHNIPKRKSIPFFYANSAQYLSEQITIKDFDSLCNLTCLSNFNDFSVLMRVISCWDCLIEENQNIIYNELDKLIDLGDKWLFTFSQIVNRAFSFSPVSTFKYLLSKIEFIDEIDNFNFEQKINKNINQAVFAAVSLSMIFALNDDEDLLKKYLIKELPQLLIFAVYIYSNEKFRIYDAPNLLISILHSMNPDNQLFEFNNSNNKELSAIQCRCAYSIIHEYDQNTALSFSKMLVPLHCNSRTINLDFIYAIGNYLSKNSILILLNLIVELAINDNVNTVLKFLPLIMQSLPEISTPQVLSRFVMFLMSFMYENGDVRLISSISKLLPLLMQRMKESNIFDDFVRHFMDLVTSNGGSEMLLSVVSEFLIVAENIDGDIYHASFEYLWIISQFLSGNLHNIIELAAIIIDSLLSLSGFKSSSLPYAITKWAQGCPTIDTLVSYVKQATEKNEECKLVIIHFLTHFASKNVIQNSNFKLNIVTLLSQIIDDIKFVSDMPDIGIFLMGNSINSNEITSLKFIHLLCDVLKYNKNISSDSYNFLNIFGNTFLFADSNNEIQTLSPDFYPIQQHSCAPPSVKSYTQYFSNP